MPRPKSLPTTWIAGSPASRSRRDRLGLSVGPRAGAAAIRRKQSWARSRSLRRSSSSPWAAGSRSTPPERMPRSSGRSTLEWETAIEALSAGQSTRANEAFGRATGLASTASAAARRKIAPRLADLQTLFRLEDIRMNHLEASEDGLDLGRRGRALCRGIS